MVSNLRRRSMLIEQVSSEGDIWYELPEPKTIYNGSTYIMTGVFLFSEDVDFTLFTKFSNSSNYPMCSLSSYGGNPRTAIGGKHFGQTQVKLFGTEYLAGSSVNTVAITHRSGSNIYRIYFSKTGYDKTKTYSTDARELRIGGIYENREDIYYQGTVSRFIVYRRCLTDEEIATLWDGGTVV